MLAHADFAHSMRLYSAMKWVLILSEPRLSCFPTIQIPSQEAHVNAFCLRYLQNQANLSFTVINEPTSRQKKKPQHSVCELTCLVATWSIDRIVNEAGH